MKPPLKPKRVLAISSGGGHWTQLGRIRKAFEGHEITWATVMIDGSAPLQKESDKIISIPDATRWNKFGLLRLMLKVLYCVIRVRPHVIISTGAAPGYFALVLGRLLRIKTCWIDSIANVEEMSLSGQKAQKWATLWLTQWKHLETPNGPLYSGSVVPGLVVPKGEETPGDQSTEHDQDKEPEKPDSKTKVIAISSGGGHWVELLRLNEALAGFNVHWVTVRKMNQSDMPVGYHTFHKINDATRWNKVALLALTIKITWLILRIRPKVIITTGAAPGYLAVMIGSWIGCKTCWIDSLANVDELSLSGKSARRWTTLWLTQWEHLATENGPDYSGMLCPELTSSNPEHDTNSAQGEQL